MLETITVLDILKKLTKENKTKWSSDITFKQFIARIRNWKKQTNISPSGRHLGVYKALLVACTNFSNKFTIDYDHELQIDCQGKSERILKIMHGLVQMSANHGFYLHHWEKVFNIMIYKTPGCIDLEKLRVLHLFEAGMNLMIGIIFGRQAMHHITDNKLYHKGQYGRPGGECLDAVYAKIWHIILHIIQRHHWEHSKVMHRLTSNEVCIYVLQCTRSTKNSIFSCFS